MEHVFHAMFEEEKERYGIAKDEAEKQLSAWERKADDSWFS